MGKKDHALNRDRMAARAQEALQFAGRLAELHARRAAALVTELALPDEIAVAVVLVEPPGITIAVHGRIEVLPLDGDNALRAQQKMVDLAAAVTVSPQQRPAVIEHPAEACHDRLLACYPGREEI